VLARHSRNKRLADALVQWSFTSLQKSPRGAGLLRRAENATEVASQGGPPGRESLGGHPARLLGTGLSLRRTDGVAEDRGHCRLTFMSKGCLYVLKSEFARGSTI
jgi:hypothetical protein